MKAAQIKEYGGPDVVEIVEVSPLSCGPGQVLVDVYAASLNPFDSAVRSGLHKEQMPLELPVTLGGDLAGVVREVGEGITDFKPGDRVFGQASAVAGNSGAFAEEAVTKGTQLAIKPADLGFEESASLPLVGVSALQAILEHINLQAGQRIFIHGGTGGIGSIAVQIAKSCGAFVAASSRGSSEEYLRELGADLAVNTEVQGLGKAPEYDAIYDTVGGKDFTKLLTMLRPGGTIVSMIPTVDTDAAPPDRRVIVQGTQVTTQRLNRLRELIDMGVIQAKIGKVFPFENVAEAFQARENGSVKGKIVLTIRK